jgi:hypothetical protein
MARLSVQNFVRITLQVGSIRSVAPNQPLPNLQKLAASSVSWLLGC